MMILWVRFKNTDNYWDSDIAFVDDRLLWN